MFGWLSWGLIMRTHTQLKCSQCTQVTWSILGSHSKDADNSINLATGQGKHFPT